MSDNLFVFACILPNRDICPLFAERQKIHRRYAILKRNEYMIDQSDLLIAYVNYGWGGAAKTLEYAVKRHKKYINFGTYET